MSEPPRRRFDRNALVPLAMTAVTVVVASLIWGRFMVPHSQQMGFDEGYEAAVVERVIDGRWLPYVDGVAHRGPFLYWTQALVHLVVGRFEWTGTRVLSLLSCVVTVAAAFLGAWAAGWALAGAVAAVIYVLVIGTVYDIGTSVAVHAEPVAIAYLMTGFALVAYGLCRVPPSRRRILLLAGGGVLVAIAGLTKQTAALSCVPIGCWIFLRELGDDDDAPLLVRARRAILRGLLPFAAGGVGLVAAVLLRFAAAGELRTFWYWSVTFNTEVYMQPYHGRVLLMLGQWFFDQPWAMFGTGLSLAVAFGRPLAALERPGGALRALRESAFEITVALTALILLFSSATPLRFWPHYFVPVFAFYGLTAGVVLEALVRRGARVPLGGQAAVAFATTGLLLVCATQRLTVITTQMKKGWWKNPRPDPACAEIDRIAGPGRTAVFIWGTAGDLYVTCRRRSASKFAYTTVIAGIVPPFWNDPRPERVGRGSREALLAELTAGRPPVVIDAPIAPGVGMVDIPIYANLLAERYCRASVTTDGRGRSLTVYARRDLPACNGR